MFPRLSTSTASRSRSLSVWPVALLLVALAGLWVPVSQYRFVWEITEANTSVSYALRVELDSAKSKKTDSHKSPITRHETGVSAHAVAPVLVALVASPDLQPSPVCTLLLEKIEFALPQLRGPPAALGYDPPDPIRQMLSAAPVTRGPPA
jgi:hypothetical protein